MPIIRIVFLIALLSCPAASWSAEPQQTTATYRDWTLRCVVAADKHKKCEVTQATHVQGRQRPVSQIAISEPVKGSPAKMVVQLPIGIWLPAGVKVSYGANEPAVIASFKRCVPDACFADATLTDAQLDKMKSAKKSGHLEFENGTQNLLKLPISFRGFAEALDALPAG